MAKWLNLGALVATTYLGFRSTLAGNNNQPGKEDAYALSSDATAMGAAGMLVAGNGFALITKWLSGKPAKTLESQLRNEIKVVKENSKVVNVQGVQNLQEIGQVENPNEHVAIEIQNDVGKTEPNKSLSGKDPHPEFDSATYFG